MENAAFTPVALGGGLTARTPEGDTVWYAADPHNPLPGERRLNLESLYLALVRHGLPDTPNLLVHLMENS